MIVKNDQRKRYESFISELVNEFPEIRDEVMDEDYDGVIST
jgi:hypothetical protein